MRRRFQFSSKALLFGAALVGVLLSGVIWKTIPIGFMPLAFMMACILFDLLTSRRPKWKR